MLRNDVFEAARKVSNMADKDRYKENLANEIHNAERAVAKASAAGAGPNHVAEIMRAQENLLRLEQELIPALRLSNRRRPSRGVRWT